MWALCWSLCYKLHTLWKVLHSPNTSSGQWNEIFQLLRSSTHSSSCCTLSAYLPAYMIYSGRSWTLRTSVHSSLLCHAECPSHDLITHCTILVALVNSSIYVQVVQSPKSSDQSFHIPILKLVGTMEQRELSCEGRWVDTCMWVQEVQVPPWPLCTASWTEARGGAWEPCQVVSLSTCGFWIDNFISRHKVITCDVKSREHFLTFPVGSVLPLVVTWYKHNTKTILSDTSMQWGKENGEACSVVEV